MLKDGGNVIIEFIYPKSNEFLHLVFHFNSDYKLNAKEGLKSQCYIRKVKILHKKKLNLSNVQTLRFLISQLHHVSIPINHTIWSYTLHLFQYPFYLDMKFSLLCRYFLFKVFKCIK